MRALSFFDTFCRKNIRIVILNPAYFDAAKHRDMTDEESQFANE